MRRIFWILIVLAAGGCKTVEVAVDHPCIRVVAKFEARDRQNCADKHTCVQGVKEEQSL